MRTALEVAHRGWGESCVIGVAAAGKEISARPFQLVTGRSWKGTAFGGWKSRTEVPRLVQTVMRGEMDLEPYITHTFQGLEKVNESITALHSGDCLRAVVRISESGLTPARSIKFKVGGRGISGSVLYYLYLAGGYKAGWRMVEAGVPLVRLLQLRDDILHLPARSSRA